MTKILDIRTPGDWRRKHLKQAQFRWAIFFVETDSRTGGRRVALHEYPKKNVGYAEDMGRTSNRFTVQGYLIGKWPDKQGGKPISYIDLKNNLIECLEQDGPGILRLPLPYQGSDIKVMVEGYNVTETRERGGMCTVEMTFVEYGNPFYRANISTPPNVDKVASGLEKQVTGTATADTAAEVAPYAQISEEARKYLEGLEGPATFDERFGSGGAVDSGAGGGGGGTGW
jgi:prophage DNA circulation protein